MFLNTVLSRLDYPDLSSKVKEVAKGTGGVAGSINEAVGTVKNMFTGWSSWGAGSKKK